MRRRSGEVKEISESVLMAQLSSQTRSIGPSAMHLKINASQLQLGRKTGECFSGRGDLKRLCHFLYEVRLHDVIMDSLHVCYGNSLMAFECRKNPPEQEQPLQLRQESSHKQKQWALCCLGWYLFSRGTGMLGAHTMSMVQCRSVWL